MRVRSALIAALMLPIFIIAQPAIAYKEDVSLYERCKQIIEDQAVKQRGTGAYQEYIKRFPPAKLCRKFPKERLNY